MITGYSLIQYGGEFQFVESSYRQQDFLLVTLLLNIDHFKVVAIKVFNEVYIIETSLDKVWFILA